jgi:protein-tyrosine-phosphatase
MFAPAPTFNVLFVGAHNATRSIIAEAIANRLGSGTFRAFSAGLWPSGAVHPYTLDMLRLQNYDLDGVRCKSCYEFARTFARPDVPDLDFVFTISDDVAKAVTPAWPGQPVVADWGMTDPQLVEASEAEKRCAFAECHRLLYQRIGVFLNLPLASLSKFALQEQVALIGRRIDQCR